MGKLGYMQVSSKISLCGLQANKNDTFRLNEIFVKTDIMLTKNSMKADEKCNPSLISLCQQKRLLHSDYALYCRDNLLLAEYFNSIIFSKTMYTKSLSQIHKYCPLTNTRTQKVEFLSLCKSVRDVVHFSVLQPQFCT